MQPGVLLEGKRLSRKDFESIKDGCAWPTESCLIWNVFVSNALHITILLPIMVDWYIATAEKNHFILQLY